MIALFVKAPFVPVYSIRGLSNKIKTLSDDASPS